MKRQNREKHPDRISPEKNGGGLQQERSTPEQEDVCTVVHSGTDPHRLTPAAAEEIVLRLSPLLSDKDRRRRI